MLPAGAHREPSCLVVTPYGYVPWGSVRNPMGCVLFLLYLCADGNCFRDHRNKTAHTSVELFIAACFCCKVVCFARFGSCCDATVV